METLKLKISLRAARINANLTLIEAAKKLGVNKSTLIKWEKHSGQVTANNQLHHFETYIARNCGVFFVFLIKIIFSKKKEPAIKPVLHKRI